MCSHADYTIQFIHALESRNRVVMGTTVGEGSELHCFSQKWESGINSPQGSWVLCYMRWETTVGAVRDEGGITFQNSQPVLSLTTG